jgi:hypothetical protein
VTSDVWSPVNGVLRAWCGNDESDAVGPRADVPRVSDPPARAAMRDPTTERDGRRNA